MSKKDFTGTKQSGIQGKKASKGAGSFAGTKQTGIQGKKNA